jgi:hypothetical protein
LIHEARSDFESRSSPHAFLARSKILRPIAENQKEPLFKEKGGEKIKEIAMSEEKIRYDETYKRLFSNPKLVEELVRYFVSEELANELDFESMETVETTTFSHDLEKKENDKLLKLKRKAGGEVYLILMLEFQSSNDFSMPVRILNYVARLYDEITKVQGEVRSLTLPAVFPVVLYNGTFAWTAKTSLDDLRGGDDDWRQATSMVQARYHLVDCTKVQPIKDSFLSVLFRLEHPESLEHFKQDLLEFGALVRQIVPNALLEDFQVWLRFVLEKKFKGAKLSHEQLMFFFPEDSMFTMNRDRLDKVLGDLEQEVYDRGAAAGLEKGRLEEGRKLLGMLLEQKFGADASRVERLENLDLAAIEAATAALLSASDEDAFWSQVADETPS